MKRARLYPRRGFVTLVSPSMTRSSESSANPHLHRDVELSKQLLNLHRAITLQELWKELRTIISSALPSHSFSLYLNYLDSGQQLRVLHQQNLPGTTSRPWDKRRRLSPTPGYLRSNVGRKIFKIKDTLAPGARLEKTAYYKKVMTVEGWESLVCLAYWERKNPFALLAVRRSPEQADFLPAELELLKNLYDHFKIALDRVRRIQQEWAARRCLTDSLAELQHGLIILDEQFDPLFRNKKALDACLSWNQGVQKAHQYDAAKSFEIPPAILNLCHNLERRWKSPARKTKNLLPLELAHPELDAQKVSVSLVPSNDSSFAKHFFHIRFVERSKSGDISQEAFLQLQKLSPREREVALGVSKGLSNAEIGKKLGKTEFTVKAQLLSIFNKLHIKRRAQLVAMLHGG
jgi:DNA-binding CsgD family transcriptional regulator